MDALDVVAKSLAVVVAVCRASWLQASSIPREVENTIEDLPIECSDLLTICTNDALCTQKRY